MLWKSKRTWSTRFPTATLAILAGLLLVLSLAPTAPECGPVPVVCPEGEPCDDGDACTYDDVCVVGLCVGTPIVCDDGVLCNGAEVCDPLLGECVPGPPEPFGTPCDDGDPCTAPDVCDGGACVGQEAVCGPGDFTPPRVTISVNPPFSSPGTPVVVNVTATDDVGVASLDVLVDGDPVTLDAGGSFTYSRGTPGAYEVWARAEDFAGNRGEATDYVRVLENSDTDPPVVDLLTPGAEMVLAGPTSAVGTIQDANLLVWRVELAPAGTNDWFTVLEGYDNMTSAVLGRLLPTKLENGMYVVRLYAEDTNGAWAATEPRSMRVKGRMKVGNYHVESVDMSLPSPGLPLEVVRVYDTRHKRTGDFGYGWTLAVKEPTIAHNRPTGDGWDVLDAGGWVPQPCMGGAYETKPHITEVRVSQDEIYLFKAQATPTGAITGACTGTMSMGSLGGTWPGATLQILGDTEWLWMTGSDEFLTWDFETFDVTRARLTTPDGRQYDVNLGGPASRVADANGNAIQIAPATLAHSSGWDIDIQRDGQGRITAVTDPAGRSVTYTYDAYGDLVAVTDRKGHTTTYSYDQDHRIRGITDALGNVPVRVEYLDGLVDALIDHDDYRVDYIYDFGWNQVITIDELGYHWLKEWDQRGNLAFEENPNIDYWEYQWDAADRLVAKIDPLGNETSYTYDAYWRKASETDPNGDVKTWTNDAAGNVLTATDERGNTTTYTYDAAGNRLTKLDPLGNTWTYTCDGRGLKLTETDPYGGIHTWTYDALGLADTETWPGGTTWNYAYDAVGNRVSRSVVRTTPAGPETLLWQVEYDANGRQLRELDPLGHATRYEYDAVGQKVIEEDALGRQTRFRYDARGLETRRVFADGTAKEWSYDGRRKLVEERDQRGAATTYEYEGAGELVVTTAPDGGTTSRDLDALGRPVGVTDALGGVTVTEYDAEGQITRVTDPGGRATTYQYDAAGNRSQTTVPGGHPTTYTYDALNRLERSTYADGSIARRTFDALGRVATEVDENGATTIYGYDADGNLVSITDPTLALWSYEYDELGNPVTFTNPLGNTMGYEYDALGRQTAVVLPLGRRFATDYDAVGNPVALTNAAGRTTVQEFDVMNRLVRRTMPDTTEETYTYTPTGKRASATDARGTTTYAYDLMDRPARRTEPDGHVVETAYDLLGRRASLTAPGGTTTYSYDPSGHLSSVTDPLGRTTLYDHDAGGTTWRRTMTDGLTTTYAYDVRGRLTGASTRDAGGTLVAGFAYVLDATGYPTQVVEDHTGRSVEYVYDGDHRITQEIIDDGGGGRPTTVIYTYDAAGNRLARDGGRNALTTYVYDANGRLTSSTDDAGVTTYSYDHNGNLVQRVSPMGYVTFTLDGRGRIVAADDGAGVVAYEYDVDGLPVDVETPGGQRRLLWDTSGPQPFLVAETDGTGALLARYVKGRELVSEQLGATTWSYFQDGWGSTRLLADGPTNPIATYDYDAFGRTLATTGATPNPLRFRGAYTEAGTGLSLLAGRWYDPETGRFLSPILPRTTSRTPWAEPSCAYVPPAH